MSALYSPPGSSARGWAEGLAWLWRLGEVSASARPELIGFGAAADAEELTALVGAGRLRAAVVAAGDPGGPGPGALLPARERVSGRARFEAASAAGGPSTVDGEFTVFAGGEVAVGSTLGAHAVSAGDTLMLGFDPKRDWGKLDAFWAYEAVARLLESKAAVTLTRLPAVGALRLDDTPGIALHQLQGRAKGDRRQAWRIGRRARQLRAAGAVLNVAVAAEALEDGRRVPLDRVWPRSVRALRAGIELGSFETVCHGLLHLDTDAFERGEVEFREFANLSAAEAGERIDRALAWLDRNLSHPATFVAPAWSYGEAGDEEGAKRGLARWHRARPGPLFEHGRLHETLIGALPGLHALDFSPLERLAAIGIPPIVAMHGALLDSRLQRLDFKRDPVTLARLLVRRDVSRLVALDGVRWLGAGELVEVLAEHGQRPAGAAR